MTRIPALDQGLRSEVGEAAGDHRSGVDHGGDLGVDEGLRGGPVEVDVVDHRDVTGAQSGQQQPGATLDPGDAVEAGQGQG